MKTRRKNILRGRRSDLRWPDLFPMSEYQFPLQGTARTAQMANCSTVQHISLSWKITGRFQQFVHFVLSTVIYIPNASPYAFEIKLKLHVISAMKYKLTRKRLKVNR